MAIPISNVTRRQVYAPSGTGGIGPYAFTFEILANTDIAVYKDDTLLTLTTHYTVTINANGTGSVTITSAGLALSPVSPTQYAVVGNRTIARSTDFTTGGDFFANTINDELDQQTIFAQQNAEGLQRALIAPQTDPTSIDMTLPRATVRANKSLAFDTNGNPVVGEVIGDNRGDWAAGVAYNKRDIVRDSSNGNIYYANASHTSIGTTPISSNADTAKWDLIVNNAAAGTSASAAAASASAASASASNASTSASNASTSASNASTSASTASTQASNASTSATGAASSASAASSSASAASGSASTASTQASNASTSASNASTSASGASTSATNAAASASTATTQASNASTSATNAASSASAASTSASNASTSATNASNSATTASTQASNASTSASNASTSATNAASSAAAAASALDSFDDRYLGTKTSDPTVDNDGNALVAGALYFSTTSNVMKVYDGASWITATSAGATSLLRCCYVATSGQTTFSGADSASATLTYTVNNIAVMRNGVTLDTSEYTASNGTSIVLTVAAGTGDIIDIIAFKSFTVADALSAVSGGTVNGAVAITGVTTVQAGSAALPAITTSGDTNTGIFFPAADTIAFSEGGVESMRITSAGNLGVNTTTPATEGTNAKVAIVGAAAQNASTLATSNSQAAFIVRADANSGYCMNFGNLVTSGFPYLQGAVFNGGASSSDIALNPFGGNVGIGTSSPSGKLDILTSASSGNNTQIYLSGLNSASAKINYAALGFEVSQGLAGIEAGAMIFRTYGSAALTERMRIGSGGNVGIGRADASDVRLIVKGVDAGSTNYAFSAENSSAFSLLYLRNDKYFNSGAIASYSTAGTTLVIDGSNFVGKLTSSLRYKKDIVDYGKGLDAIAKLRPVYYKSAIEGPNGIDPKQHAGFIAEEIADEGFEEFLIRNSEGEPDAIQYAQMTALLCKAIQEQQALIVSMREELDALKTKVGA